MNSWIWKLAQELDARTLDKDIVVFQTGFGPSGSPHIGTFAEVARTTMVRRAFEQLTGKTTRLIVFSDDMDALRKVPTNVPNREMLEQHLGKSLSSVPNPFETAHKSFSEHNNAKLQEFLDAYGFDYEFVSSTECYKSGLFNDTLKLIAGHASKIKEIVTHDYGDRKDTYCPFIVVDNHNYQHFELKDWHISLIYEPMIAWDGDNPNGMELSTIIDGAVKCQWKVDWPMRWIALDVDFEMHGKDLIGSAQVGQRICKAVGKPAPMNYMYELFMDKDGKKISKSVGNGFEFEEWIRYAPAESLQWFLFQNPRKSRKLFWEVVPMAVDSYLKEYAAERSVNNAIWAIHGDDELLVAPPLNFTMLINLVSITNTSDPQVLWGFVRNYVDDATAEKYPLLDVMIRGAINYYADHIEPTKERRNPTDEERVTLSELADAIEGKETADDVMTEAYEVGKKHYGAGKELRLFFQMIYQVIMGQDSGPRFGQFAEVYGVENTVKLLRDRT